MGDILGLGVTHYPGLTAQGNLCRRIKICLADSALPERLRTATEHVFPDAAPPPPELEGADAERPLDVRYQDIDQIQHVTNSSYLAWAIEAVPEQTWRSCRLAAAETAFLAECRHGGRVLSRLARLGEREFAHAIVREEDGKELARLVTTWTAREATVAGE